MLIARNKYDFRIFFIRNPVFAGVLSIVIFLTGLISMFNLPVEQYPRVLPPQIIVSTAYPGASADTLAKKPLRLL